MLGSGRIKRPVVEVIKIGALVRVRQSHIQSVLRSCSYLVDDLLRARHEQVEGECVAVRFAKEKSWSP